jgi:hypothetical protein
MEKLEDGYYSSPKKKLVDSTKLIQNQKKDSGKSSILNIEKFYFEQARDDFFG